MTKEEFKPIAAKLKMAYKRDGFLANLETLDFWLSMLHDLDAEHLDTATENYIKRSQFPPTIADLREEYAKVADGEQKYKNELRELYLSTKGVYPSSEDTQNARVAWSNLVKSESAWQGRLDKARYIAKWTAEFVEKAEQSGMVDELPTWEDYLRGLQH